MYDQLLNKRNIVIAAIGFFALVIMFLPVNIPFSITVIGKVVSGQQWLLVRQADGSIMSTMYDHSRDMTESYTAYQVDRGDVIQFKMRTDLRNLTPIVSGDTVGYIFSNMLFQELNKLVGALNVAKANLDVVSTGERETIISEARDQFLLNRERSLVQNEILERQTKLYQDALVSREDFEITRGMARIYKLEMQVAEAHLKTLQTGEKQEIIAQARFQIAAIERELMALQDRLSEFTLTAPLSGKIHVAFSPDTLLMVFNDTRVVLIPIPWKYINEVNINYEFTTEPIFDSEVLEGSIVNKSNYMRLMAGQQVFIVAGILTDQESDLPVNMLVQCSISGMKRTPWDYVLNFLQVLI